MAIVFCFLVDGKNEFNSLEHPHAFVQCRCLIGSEFKAVKVIIKFELNNYYKQGQRAACKQG